MQNILGRDLEGKHWARRIAYPFGIMGLSIVISQILNKKWIKILCLPLILLILAYGLVRQTKMSYKISDAYALNSEKTRIIRLDKQKYSFRIGNCQFGMGYRR